MSAKASLFINDLDLLINLGWPDSERMEKQTVRVNIEIFFTTPPKGCVSDDLKDAYCYDDLIQTIFEKTKNKSYRLIEYLCQEIHFIVKATFTNQEKIIVSVIKHPTITGFSGSVRFAYDE